MRRQAQYLLSYDIADPKRLQRIHRVLKKAGLPVQYSVFSLVVSQRQLDGVLEYVLHLMDEREDDVRCYALPSVIECKTLGRQFFPDDIMLFSRGVERLLIGRSEGAKD